MPDSRAQLQAALADRFTIHHELGRGGMAAVYLATDLRNRRRVALKVLAEDVTNAISVARFLREIEIAGRLDHPHILPLLDSGAADGLAYYTMPFVEGESLRERLRREKQLPVDDALRITTEIADALAYAHSRGIIHRDIKPDNILLADGHARVADFGIARAVTGGADSAGITATGLAIGTPPYMSPEQLTGSRDLDARSDVYSLGCVLYEMLAGEAPYTGPNAQAILAKRLREPLPRVTVMRETVPPHVERAIERALARAPADRFATADAFSEGLRAIPNGARRPFRSSGLTRIVIPAGAALLLAALVWKQWPDRDSRDANADVIAVLPFRVHTEDGSAAYLSEAILDYLSAQLTGEGAPRAVDSRAMLQAWRLATAKGENELPTEEALELARRFGAGRVLLGEVVRTSAGTRISGRILDTRGAVLATRTETGAEDPLLLVDRLTGRLLAGSAGEEHWRIGRLSDSLTAVKEYLAGVSAHRKGDYARARRHLARALEIDSTFALASLRMFRNQLPVDEMLRHTAIAWRLRTRLSPRDRAIVEAHFGTGPNYPEMSTTSERIAAHERAASLNPDDVDVLTAFGTYLLVYGQQAGIHDAQVRSAELLDSALALDSSYGPAAQWRLTAALALKDTAALPHLTRLEERLNPETNRLFPRLSAFVALRDTSGFTRVARHEAALAGTTWGLVASSGAYNGFAMEQVERHVRGLLMERRGTILDRRWYLRALFHIAAVQGRAVDALTLGDSAANRDFILALAMTEPVYAAALPRVLRRMEQVDDSLLDGDGICYRELLRVKHGDTTATRRSIRRMQLMVRDYPPAPIPRVGRFGVCGLLLELMLAGNQESAQLAALRRLEKVVRAGVGLETPGELAILFVTRALYARGEYAAAYDIIRRRPYIHNVFFTVHLPSYLREEGRLAATLGDTAAAIRAYQHYLAIRIQPDPGPIAEEVRQVRRHLDVLRGVASGRAM